MVHIQMNRRLIQVWQGDNQELYVQPFCLPEAEDSVDHAITGMLNESHSGFANRSAPAGV